MRTGVCNLILMRLSSALLNENAYTSKYFYVQHLKLAAWLNLRLNVLKNQLVVVVYNFKPMDMKLNA